MNEEGRETETTHTSKIHIHLEIFVHINDDVQLVRVNYIISFVVAGE